MQALEQDLASPSDSRVDESARRGSMQNLQRLWLPGVLLLVTFAHTVPTIPSADMWWHLSNGHYIVQNHVVPHTDPFSATAAGKPWVAHEWLSDILFYSVYPLLGSAGLLLLVGAVQTLAFWFAYARLDGHPLARVLALGLGLWAATPIFSVRPQIFTYLFAAVFLLLLTRYVQLDAYKLLIALPLVSLLWVNLHGGYMLGPALVLLFAAGVGLDWLLGREDAGAAKKRIVALMMACAACLAVVPLNPNGLAMYTYPFATLNSAGMQTGIMEWHSPDFHMPIFHGLAVLLFLTVATLALSPKRPKPSEILLFVFFAFAVLYSMRNLPLFVLVAFPLLGAYAFVPSWKLPTIGAGVTKALQLIVLFVVAAFSAKTVSNHIASELDLEQSRFPARAASFLDAQKLPAPLFNSYDFGGYLIWRLYPRYHVYIDGRADLYGDAFLNHFVQVYEVNVDPRPALDREAIRTVFVESRSPLASFLRTQKEWNRVYEDPIAVIFTR